MAYTARYMEGLINLLKLTPNLEILSMNFAWVSVFNVALSLGSLMLESRAIEGVQVCGSFFPEFISHRIIENSFLHIEDIHIWLLPGDSINYCILFSHLIIGETNCINCFYCSSFYERLILRCNNREIDIFAWTITADLSF